MNMELSDRNVEICLVIAFLISLSFFQFELLTVNVDGTTIFRPDWLFGFGIIVYVVLGREVEITAAIKIGGVFMLVVVVSTLVNPLRSAFDLFTFTGQLIFALALFGAVSSLNLDTNDFRAVLRLWVGFITAVAFIAILQALAYNVWGVTPKWIPGLSVSANRGVVRPETLFTEPSYLASTLVIGFTALFPSIAMGKSVLFERSVEILLLGVVLAGLAVSGSFSGYLTTGASFVMFVFFVPINNTATRVVSYALLSLSVVLIVAINAVPTEFLYGNNQLLWIFNQRFDKIVDVFKGGSPATISGSIGVRWARTLSGLVAWKSNPLFGVGPGQFSTWAATFEFSEPLRTMNRTEWGQLGSLHGAYIQILAQTGGAGVTAFVSMMGVIVLESIQTIRDAETNQAFAVVALCIITVQLIDWAFTFSAIHPMRWGVIGLMYGFISDQL